LSKKGKKALAGDKGKKKVPTRQAVFTTDRKGERELHRDSPEKRKRGGEGLLVLERKEARSLPGAMSRLQAKGERSLVGGTTA